MKLDAAEKYIKNWEPVRLFPGYKKSQAEQRILSSTLACLVAVQPFRQQVFSRLGYNFGIRSDMTACTEVVMQKSEGSGFGRPDAFVLIGSGKRLWSAIIEAKVGSTILDTEQLNRYISLARDNDVDAVITISNQLTLQPDMNPSGIKLAKNSRVALYHLSWPSLLTDCELLLRDKSEIFNNDQAEYLIGELHRFYKDSESGVSLLTQMNSEWPDIVNQIYKGNVLSQKSAAVQNTIATWNQKQRDIALLLRESLNKSRNLVKYTIANWRQIHASATHILRS